MKPVIFLAVFFLNFVVSAKELMPCQFIDFKTILNSTVPWKNNVKIANISLDARNEEIQLLNSCLNNDALCIVESKIGAPNWFSKTLVKPDNAHFNPKKQQLMFAVMQFIDEKTKQPVCIVARNTFNRALPWVAKAWVIDSDINKKYLVANPAFYHTMTPEILYQSLLNGYEQAKIDAIDEDKWFEENKKHQLLTVHGYKNTNIKQVDNLSATAISSKELFDPTMMAVGIAVNQIKSLQKTWF